jgi:hypothetical protein
MKFKENKRLREIVKLSINQQKSAFLFAIFAILHNSLNLLQANFLPGLHDSAIRWGPGSPPAKIKITYNPP